jgi:hypothetical protein
MRRISRRLATTEDEAAMREHLDPEERALLNTQSSEGYIFPPSACRGTRCLLPSAHIVLVSYRSDHIPMISLAPHRVIRLSTVLPSRHSKACTVKLSSLCSHLDVPWHSPCTKPG